MKIYYTESERALQAELRQYFETLLPPEVRAELTLGELAGPTFRRLLKQMGEDGWLGIGWPEEYGGQGRSYVEQFIFFDEADRAAAPVPFLTIKSIGPVLMEAGTPEQQADYLPRILRGDIHFSIGYTEPEAGTDLAALRTRAVADGDDYVINGSKIFTSYVGDADYIWLAARTSDDPDKKHRGISIFIVPTDAPGLSITPIDILAGTQTFATYYNDVRLPRSALVGEEGKGWYLIMSQLNHERVAMSTPGRIERALEEVARLATETTSPSGVPLSEESWVRLHLGRIRAKLDVLRLLNWQVAVQAQEGRLDPAAASTTKVFGSELYNEAYQLLMEVLSLPGSLRQGSAGAATGGRIENEYRIPIVMTFGGGTNEVQRDIIAGFALELPRSLG